MKKIVGVIAACSLIFGSISLCAAEDEAAGPNPSVQAIEKANEHAAFKRVEGGSEQVNKDAEKAEKEAEKAKNKADKEAEKAKKDAEKAAKKAQKAQKKYKF